MWHTERTGDRYGSVAQWIAHWTSSDEELETDPVFTSTSSASSSFYDLGQQSCVTYGITTSLLNTHETWCHKQELVTLLIPCELCYFSPVWIETQRRVFATQEVENTKPTLLQDSCQFHSHFYASWIRSFAFCLNLKFAIKLCWPAMTRNEHWCRILARSNLQHVSQRRTLKLFIDVLTPELQKIILSGNRILW